MNELNIMNDEIVLESYIGKTNTLKECENVLNQLRDLLIKTPTLDVTNHPLNRKLESLLQKEFGFKRVYVVWPRLSVKTKDISYLPNLTVPVGDNPNRGKLVSLSSESNAYTLTNCMVFFKDLCNRKDNDNDSSMGYYDRGHQHVLYINISIAMITYSKLTGGELLAILLHEIGHNFDNTPHRFYIKMLGVFNSIFVGTDTKKWLRRRKENGTMIMPYNMKELFIRMKTITAPAWAGSNIHKDILGKASALLNTVMDVIPFARDIEIFVTQIIHIKDQLPFLNSDDWREFESWLKEKPIRTAIKTNPFFFVINSMATISTKKMEKFADSFAVIYGYGSELSTALTKTTFGDIAELKTLTDNFPAISFVADLRYAFHYVVNCIVHPDHGSDIERAVFMLQTLQKELNSSDIHPGMKKEIEEEITKLKKIIDNLQKKTIDDKYYLASVFQWVILRVFEGNVFLAERLFPDYTA